MFFTIGVLKNFVNFTIMISQESTFVGVFFWPEGLEPYWKEAPTQLLSCGVCEDFKNTVFAEHLRWLLLNIVNETQKYINYTLFYMQPVCKQLAIAWQIANQLSGFNTLSLNNNKNYRLKESEVFHLY